MVGFIFILGLVSGMLLNEINTEVPISEKPQIMANPNDKPSPMDRIPEKDIFVYNDRVVIKLRNPEWSRFLPTKSMVPVFDTGANAIEIVPRKAEDLQVGDIISYESEYGLIIHRITEIGTDEEGWYAQVQGDNNPDPDPFKIRFDQVRRVVVGIIY